MSFGFGFALPAYPLRGGTGNNPFNQLGPTLDLSFTGVVTDLTDPNGYTLNTDFIIPQYQIAAQYVVWETGVGLVDKTFSQIITFTRASIGTYFDSAGVLQTATSGTPRFDYDPVTLAPRGFLIEEARTNVCLQSAALNTTPWSVVGGNSSISANTTIAPDGTTTGDSLIPDTTAGVAHLVTQPAIGGLDRAVQRVISVFVKLAGYQGIRIQDNAFSGNFTRGFFNLSTLTASTVQNGNGVASGATITNVGNGWYRCSYISTPNTVTGGGSDLTIAVVDTGFNDIFAGNGTSGVVLWGCQVEAGAFPTSYIPTTTGTVPRNADQASVNTLSPWYNATEGTVYAEATVPQLGRSARLFVIDAGSTTDMIDTTVTGANAFAIEAVAGGVYGGSSLTANTITANAIQKTAATYSTGSNETACLNGGTAASANVTLPSVSLTTMRLGYQSNFAATLNGWLRRIVYYPRRLTNDELRTITLPTGATITTQDYSLDTNFVGNTVAIGS